MILHETNIHRLKTACPIGLSFPFKTSIRDINIIQNAFTLIVGTGTVPALSEVAGLVCKSTGFSAESSLACRPAVFGLQ